MKPEAAVLIVSFAAALGACGDRSEEAGAPVSEPAPRVGGATPRTVAEAPAEPAPAMSASEPDADAAAVTAPPPAAVAQVPPQAASATPRPGAAAVSPPAAAPAPPAEPAAVSSASGTVLRAEKLYSEPASTSKVTASVAKGTRVEILGKQAGWLRVKAGSQSGWIRLLSVRTGAGGLGAAGVGDVVGAATTRSDPTRVVAVAGLRGLDDEDLKQAKFNAEELARMDASSVSPTQARAFANQSGLAVVSVPDLPKPQAQQSSTWESN